MITMNSLTTEMELMVLTAQKHWRHHSNNHGNCSHLSQTFSVSNDFSLFCFVLWYSLTTLLMTKIRDHLQYQHYYLKWLDWIIGDWGVWNIAWIMKSHGKVRHQSCVRQIHACFMYKSWMVHVWVMHESCMSHTWAIDKSYMGNTCFMRESW